MNLKDAYLHGTDLGALVKNISWSNGKLVIKWALEGKADTTLDTPVSGANITLSTSALNFLTANNTTYTIQLPSTDPYQSDNDSRYLKLATGGTVNGVITISPKNTNALLEGLVLHDNGNGGSEALWIKWTSASYTTGVKLRGEPDSNKLKFYNGTDWYEVYHTGNLSPMTTSHPANGITSTNISNWNSAYNWYNLTVATESDTDTVINKWKEVTDFLNGITDTETLTSLLAGRVAKSGDTMTGALTTPGLTVTGAATFSQAINGSILGNAATASRLQNARNIAISGAVTGNANFDGSGNITISTSVNHTHSYLPLAGGQMTGHLTWSDNVALPRLTSPQYFLVIDAFDSGGTTKWSDILSTLKALGIKDSSGNNVYLPLTGGTLTNTDYDYILTVNNSGGGNSGIKIQRGVNTAWGILVSSGNFYLKELSTNTNFLTINEVSQGSLSTFAGLVKSTGFVKTTSSDSYVLLGGGGHKLISEFTTLSGEQTITGNKTFTGSVSIDDLTAGNLVVTGGASFAQTINGNAATASRLATARTISLTGSVTGSGTFDGSGNLSITTTTNHNHDYLYSVQVEEAQTTVSWAIEKAKTVRRGFIYNTNGAEYSYLFGLSSTDKTIGSVTNNATYGAILKMGYSDNYLRILRVHAGKWFKPNNTLANLGSIDGVDWEKISAGYADSAGNDSDGNAINTTYLKLSGGTLSSSNDVLKIKSSGVDSWIYFLSTINGNSANRASVGYYKNLAFLANEKTHARIGVNDSGIPEYWPDAVGSNKLTLLHTGNYTSYCATNTHNHDTVYVKKGGDTMTGLLTTTSGNNHNGIKVGNTYINAIDGELIFQNNSSIRFGGDSWDYSVWAGLKYIHSSKIVCLGLADGSAFITNSALTGGKLYTPGINDIYIGNGVYTVYHTGNHNTLLRKVTVAKDTTNDFNTFENMTLTGRGDPATGASLVNAPWSGSGPAGGYGVLTYLWSGYGYGTQMAWGYASNKIYIRYRYYSNSSTVWTTTWDSLMLASETYNKTTSDARFVLKAGDTMTGALTVPSLSVTGAATFSQAINGSILGNAATASRLLNARNIAISGAVTGNANFDGSGNITISTSVNHTHNYAGSGSVGGASTNVVVNDSNANSTYRMVWHSGNTLYSTGGIYCNPNSDTLYAANAAFGTKSQYYQRSTRGTVHHEFVGSDQDYGVMKIRHTAADGSGNAGSYTATLAVIDERTANLSSGYEPNFYINKTVANTGVEPDLMGVTRVGSRLFTIASTGFVTSNVGLAVINDSSNSAYDTLAYFRSYANNDWGMIIDKSTSYTYGLYIKAGGTYALKVDGSSRFASYLKVGADAAPSCALDVTGDILATGDIRASGNDLYIGSTSGSQCHQLYDSTNKVLKFYFD